MKYYKYYIPWLILFGVMIVISLITTLPNLSDDNIFQKLSILISVWIGGSATIGTLLLYYDLKWGPKARIKYLSKPPLTELKEIGFELIDDCYVGLYKGYYFLIGYDWRGINNNEFFFVSGLFKATENEDIFEYSVFKYLEDKYNIYDIKWDLNIAQIQIYGTIKRPKLEKIIESMDKLSDCFKSESLEPISYDLFKNFKIEDYNITDKKDNPSTIKAKSIKPIKKKWYLRNITWIAITMIIGCIISIVIFVDRLFLDPFEIIASICIGIITISYISRDFYRLKLMKIPDLIASNIINGAATAFFLFTLINFIWTDNSIKYLTFDKFEFYNEKSEDNIRLHLENEQDKKTIDITKQDYENLKTAKSIGVAYETTIMGYKKIINIYIEE